MNLLLRKGNPGFNSNEAEATYQTRTETEWPLARTVYKAFYLSHPGKLLEAPGDDAHLELEALGHCEPVQFAVEFSEETEIAGHPTASLWYSVKKRDDGSHPRDLDVFVTLRHIDPTGQEVFYTGKPSQVDSADA